MRIILTSDTHGRHAQIVVPPGDVLIHAGDLTHHGTSAEIAEVLQWLAGQPHRHKLVIAGNHDRCMQDDPHAPELFADAGVMYLCDHMVTIEGLRFYGTPWQPHFRDMAFNLPRGPQLRDVWAGVPADLDVLITHTPPQGILDRTFMGMHVGCADLAAALPRLRPRLHVFGHIHEAAGMSSHSGTTFVNASALNLLRAPVNPPLLFDL